MKYREGDLVLVQTSYNTKLRKKYAIVQSQYFNSVKVKFMQTGEIKSYVISFITPVTTEKK
jgi:hypothetical protein